MKNRTLNVKKILHITAIIIMSIIVTGISMNVAKAENTDFYSFSVFVNADFKETEIKCQNTNGENVFVLPSSVKPESVAVFAYNNKNDLYIEGALKKEKFISGMSVNLNDYCENEDYVLTFMDGKNAKTVRFLFSENVPAVFIVSENPSDEGREWVEASPDKSNNAKGSMIMVKENGETVYNGALTQIKGRGNSTWEEVKKPYQIKTEIKTDLLETGNSDNESKTWVLLANYLDASVLNNSFALNFGKAMGMQSNIESTHVDLYYDGEYRGSYLLAEKVEVGSGRVNIEDMEEKNASANENTDIENLPVKTATTDNGVFYTYCENMISPEDITGGYLVEMDYKERAEKEVCYFRTSRGQYMVVKSPEYASKEEMEYIASFYQEYEDAVYNGGVNPSTGKAYSDYVDAESIACYYIVNELSKSRDFFGSSAYLYKNAGEDRMYMGPLWDYDLGFGKSRYEINAEEPSLGMSVYKEEFGIKLFQIKDFVHLTDALYSSKFYPYLTAYFSENETEKYSAKEYISASAKCNAHMWHSDIVWEDEAEKFENFIKERAEFLKDMFSFYSQNVSDGESAFYDVTKNFWFYESVRDIKQLGYMNGVNKYCFDPYAKVRRSELAQTLFNMSGEIAPGFSQIFSDVNSADWYADAALWAADKNLMSGIDGEVFLPEQNTEREYVAVALYRYFNEPTADGTISEVFVDRESVSGYAKDAVIWATQNGILQGDDKGRLNPGGYITRAEFATMLVRLSRLNE